MVDGTVTRAISADGVELAVVEAGPSDRPTVVLIHGYPDTKELWDWVLAALAPSHHVVAYDVRGAGSSSAPRGAAAYDLERLGDDLAAVLAAVAPERKAHLVGHDWGALQGWEFVTQERFRDQLQSFTAIAGPSLDQLRSEDRTLPSRPTPLRVVQAVRRLRHSWYVLALLTPGVPTLAWRVLFAGGRWNRMLEALERVPSARVKPSPTLASDGVNGANLYRRNVPRRLLRPPLGAVAHAPVQLIVPSRDRFIPEGYYALAERCAPGLRRRTIGTTHWAPLTHPELIARWVGEFVDEVEAGTQSGAPVPWVRGGGLEQLEGRLALVTGAASGIGLATARALTEHGARLLLVDNDPESLGRAAGSIAHSHALQCDVGNEHAMKQLAARVLGEHGVPDVLVNNAGIAVAGSFLDTGFEDWDRIIATNLMGVVLGCRLFGAAMVQRGAGGQIVNMASAAAFQPTKELGAYAATKAAVLMLSECLRAELGPHGIGVTAVCPGFIPTNIALRARYVGRSEDEQRRIAARATENIQRRNFTPERVAGEVLRAIAADRPVALITPEAKVLRVLSRFAPGASRRLAKLDSLPG